MDLLQWSRHFRTFRGQGDLPVDAFMAAVEATGYDDWLSLEIFNDRLRATPARRISEDGERLLIWLGDRIRPGALPPRARPEGVEWVEFAVSEKDAHALGRLLEGLGFRETGRRRSKQVARWSQGAVNLVINTEPEGLAFSYQIVHGPSVVGLGLRVGDAAAALRRAEGLRIPAFRQPVGAGETHVPAVQGVGGALIAFVDGTPDLARIREVEFEAVGEAPPARSSASTT